MQRSILATFCITLSCLWPSSAAAEDFYTQEIKPLLKTRCVSCHGALKQEGSLRLDTGKFVHTGGDSGPSIDLEQPELSLLLERVSDDDPDYRMPPDDATPLTPAEIAKLDRWISQGAKYPASEVAQQDPKHHWSYQPLAPFDTQATIDSYIDAQLTQADLTRNPPADRATLLRRLYLDMHGLLPTPDQVEAFLADHSPEAYAKVVDQVLDSPRYGERWAQHWLDVIRYADTDGFEVNTPRENAWPYRDYVIGAFNEDKPYDQFIREQLAGDAFDQHAATGFLVAAPALLPGQIGQDDASKRLARQDSLDEIIVGTTATLLGVTAGCARCHDHKFDPFTQQDYYALQAFFAGVEYGEREVEDQQRKTKLAQAAQLGQQLQTLDARLDAQQPLAFAGQTLIIDDEDTSHISYLQPADGHAENPPGTERGFRNDEGSEKRLPNFSRFRHTWWKNQPGANLFAYQPDVDGKFHLWISWGVHGRGSLTHDARYLLDADGNLETTNDQQEIALVDQYYPANVNEGSSKEEPRWSGLLHTGVHHFTPATKIVLRGGDTGTQITTDVIVLQEQINPPPSQGGARGGSDLVKKSTQAQFLLPNLRQPVTAKSNVERFAPVAAKYIRFTSLETTNDNRYEPCLDELQVFTPGPETKNVALATNGTIPTSSGNYSDTVRHKLEHINDGQFGNSHSWISNEKGRGWVQLELPEVATIDRIVWGRDRQQKFADRLPIRYRIEVATEPGNWTTVAHSDDRLPFGTPHDEISYLARRNQSNDSTEFSALLKERNQLATEKSKLEAPKKIFAGIFRKPDVTHVLNRGDPEQPQQKIGPQFISLLGERTIDPEATDQQRRLALADWIASPTNPLTARVIVNRLWQHHFGRGIVDTPSDFGINGAKPTHPQLLDWLAHQLINNHWSLKHIHRLILLSHTYQQSNHINAAANKIDADARLLWRYPSRRLEAEAIRDSMLQICDSLNLKMGGPGFNFFKTRGGLSGFPPLEKLTPEEHRRMIYAHRIRMERVPVFGAFDCPTAGLPSPSRSRSITAIQALNLFNSKFVIDQSQILAERLRSSADTLEEQIHLAYELTFSRQPTATELTACTQVATNHNLETVCRALFNSNEFLFIP